MPTEIAAFTFDKGVNQKKNPLFLEDGELMECSGFGYQHDGQLEARTPNEQDEVIDTTATSIINGIHRYAANIYASSKKYCEGDQVFFNYISRRITTGSFSEIDILLNNTRPRFADYENFTFVVDGYSKQAYVDDYDYVWGVDNPSYAPTVTPGAGSANPNGTYNCYVTFYIKFPNDKYVETGPSPVGEVTVSEQKIEWTGIPICPYQGGGLNIHRRLYRMVSGESYLVTEIEDNTTQSYSDNVADDTLQLAAILGTSGYSTPPAESTDIEVYLQRVFLIKGTKFYWSEPYSPFSFLTTSSIVVTKEEENLVGIIDWGDQVYLVSKEQWYRLQGSDPDTWIIKRTFTDKGIINRHTIKKSKYGIIGLGYDGIYLFDGMTNRNITCEGERAKLPRSFFTGLDDLSVCYAEFDGFKYWFYYASSGTTIDSCLVIDFSHYPDLRIYFDDFVADAHEFHHDSGHRYLAKDGYEYEEGTTETIATSFETGEKPFGNVLKRKCLEYLYYDINSSGENAVVNILVDGSTADTLTLNTSSRQRKRSRLLKSIEGYRIGFNYSCSDSKDVIVYAPWAIQATLVGE